MPIFQRKSMKNKNDNINESLRKISFSPEIGAKKITILLKKCFVLNKKKAYNFFKFSILRHVKYARILQLIMRTFAEKLTCFMIFIILHTPFIQTIPTINRKFKAVWTTLI